MCKEDGKRQAPGAHSALALSRSEKVPWQRRRQRILTRQPYPFAGDAYLMDNVVNVTINLAHGHTEGRLPSRERYFPSIAGLPPTLRMENGRRQQQKSRFEGNLGDSSLVRKPETKKTKIARARKRDCVGMTHMKYYDTAVSARIQIAQRHPASIHGSAGG